MNEPHDFTMIVLDSGWYLARDWVCLWTNPHDRFGRIVRWPNDGTGPCNPSSPFRHTTCITATPQTQEKCRMLVWDESTEEGDSYRGWKFDQNTKRWQNGNVPKKLRKKGLGLGLGLTLTLTQTLPRKIWCQQKQNIKCTKNKPKNISNTYDCLRDFFTWHRGLSCIVKMLFDPRICHFPK